MKTHSATVPAAAADFLTGGGEMELLIREFDWSATPLGPLDSWPQNLRTCVRIMLTSRQPFWLGWGKELIKLYNDPYKAILGGKHPRALGRPASIVWKDIWKDIDPLLRQVMELDKGTYAESQLLIMERNGYPEETYYTFSYTPIPGEDGKTAGMICANTDDTERIISERRLRTLTELGQVLTEANSAEDVFATAQAVLQKNPQDFPFTCCYGLSGNQRARLTANPLGGRPLPLPAELDLGDPGPLAQALAKAAASGERQLLTGLDAEFGPLPRGAWPVSSGRALLIPIFQNSQDRLCGFLLAGLNPYQLLNEKYQNFFSLITDQVSGRLSRIRHDDEELKRLQTVAEFEANIKVLAHKKMEADEKLFRTLTETIPQLIWMTDEKGNQEYVSGKWLEYSGVDPKDNNSWESILHEDDRKPIEEVWRKSLRSGAEYRIEVRLKSRAGEFRWHLGQGSPIYNEGRIIRWIGSFMDIHDQKTFSERLERLVFHRTAELQRSNEELEQFAHVASHDLREPLRKIRTFASLLTETVGLEMPEKVRTYLDKIDSAAIRMNSMIQGILRYSSFQEAVEKEGPVNLNEVLRKIETDLEVLIGQKKATLQLEPLPVLIADSFRLYQLFYNLIANALKFSRPEEPPLIRISQRSIPYAEWAVLPRNTLRPYVSIQVEDNGIGFDPEFSEKIFKSFTRLNALDKYEGTGLGLALCKKIVTAYSGSIRATGVEGKGARFIMDLPLLADDQAR